MTPLASNQYANPAPDYFWCWSRNDSAAEWRLRGKTLALWDELHPLLHHLAVNGGLPPLGAMMLLIGACRDEWPESEPQLHDWIRSVGGNANPAGEQVWAALRTGLMAVRRLPSDLRASQQAKGLLAAHVFEDPACRMGPEQSLEVMEELVSGPRVLRSETSTQDSRKQFLEDSRALLTGLAKLDQESLESLLRTGLEQPELFHPLLVEATPAPLENRPLLDELAGGGGEERAVAAVAKRAIAMIHFPGRLGIPNELPVGGISDITNRGTLDRLLPAELAWDDLVLATRLVHNEALYFRREDPPEDTPLRHTILLDRGLRLWGQARILSLGVALGLAHHPSLLREGTIGTFATTPTSVEPIDLATKTGVRQALEALVPSPGPEEALSSWLEALEASSAPEDLVFITARAHLESPRCRTLLGGIATLLEARAGSLRVIAVEGGGDLEMQSWSSGGNRVIFRGTFEDEVTPRPRRTAIEPSLSAPKATEPWMAQKPRSPFLFPANPHRTAFIRHPESDAGIGISADGRLMRWPKPSWGAHLLSNQLEGREKWIAESDGNIFVITSADKPGGKPQVHRLSGSYLHHFRLDPPSHSFPRFATVRSNAVLFCYTDFIEAFSLETGRQIAELRGANLPDHPILDFDGARIAVLGSHDPPPPEPPFWSYPTMMPAPELISVWGGVLSLKCGESVHTFDPEDFSWKETAGPMRGDVIRFQPVGTRLAASTRRCEAEYHPHGILSLRNPHAGKVHWEILLAPGKTSVLYSARGLFSFEPRLRMPDQKQPPYSIPRKLARFLHDTPTSA